MELALINLSKLDGKVSQMTAEERNVLLRPFVLMESTKSSAIEGTGTTIEDIYMSERVEETDIDKINDNREVLNYRDALLYATRDHKGEITEDLVLELHSILMKGVRGETKSPGTYRTAQVFVGSKWDDLDTARFVPLPPEQVPWKIRNLFDYMNDENENVLLSAALSHYQFETIHPFTDGNGRMGRLLIMLILSKGGVLEYPVLYLSGYFNNYRDEYINRLNGIREKDDFESWIMLFLDALIEQSNRSMDLIDSLFSYRKQLYDAENDRNAIRLIDSLFVNPYIRKADVAEMCGIHISTAGKLVNSFVDKGILREISGKRRNQLFVCDNIIRMLNSY
ncbi:MAG: Fic family protein [Candidatus Methanomethylophilaceae archaeon]